MDRDRLEMEGVVKDASSGQFMVEVNPNHMVLATISGKMRINGIKILVGDKVLVEVSPYDVYRGRIVRRLK
jgi:translation initiation factor IF-1